MVVLKMLEVCIAPTRAHICAKQNFRVCKLKCLINVLTFYILTLKNLLKWHKMASNDLKMTVLDWKTRFSKLAFLKVGNRTSTFIWYFKSTTLQLFWLLREGGEALTWVEKVKNHFHLSQSAWREDLTPLKMTCPTIPYCRTLMTVTSMNNRARIYLNNGQTFFRIHKQNK